MNKQLLLNDLATLLNMSPNAISMDLNLSTHAYWDSLSVISLIGAIDEHYKISISGEELTKAVIVADIFAMLKARQS